MNSGLATLFYRNPYVLWLSIVVIITAGIGSLMVLPRAEDPTILNRAAFVLTPFPGATAKRVEALVTEPIETELRRAPEIKHLNSSSLPGFSFIQIELKDSVTQSNEVFSRLRDYVADAMLPAGAGPIAFDDTRSYPFTKIIAFKVNNNKDWLLAKRYATELAARLRVVKDTDKVSEFGAPQEEILISVDPQAIANLNLTITQLAKIIEKFDSKISSGSIQNKSTQILIEVSGGFELLQRIRELPIASKNQSIVQLHDIAKVSMKPKTPVNNYAFVDNQQAIVLAMRMVPHRNINQWSERIDKAIDAFQQQFPEKIQLTTIFSQKDYTNQRFTSLQRNILLGISSIVLILFVTLGIRCAFIVALSLPLTMLLTFFGIRLIGLDLQQMTVIGLVVALGIMIDNAIVIAESIQHKRLHGTPSLQAVVRTVRHLWLPLLGATSTTVLAFFPIILLPGPEGEFVGGIGYSVIITLIGSYLISHTIIASLAARYLQPMKKGHWYQLGIQAPKLEAFFTKILRWCLSHVKKSTLIISLFSLSGFVALLGLTEQFFPASERNQINLSFYVSPVASIENTKKIANQMQQLISQDPKITTQAWYIGRSGPPFYYNLVQKEENNPSYAQAMLTLKDNKNIKSVIKKITKKIRQTFPASINFS